MKRSIFPPAHVHPFSTPSPFLPSPLHSGSSHRLFLPLVVWTWKAPRFQFRAISLPPFTSPVDHHPLSGRAGRSLISISSRRVENIARVSSYAGRTRDCQAPSFVLHFARLGVRGRKGCANVHEMFAIAVLFVSERYYGILREILYVPVYFITI